jgi:glycosyltransferase involved in cell wall biosynthesis
MKISYAILTHNETQSLQDLIDLLVVYKDDEDEIVILDDYSDDKKTQDMLDALVSIYDIVYEQRHLHKDYAGQKNHLTGMCKGQYIVNIDADEIPHPYLMKNLKDMLEANPTIDLFWVPRVNTVTGLTQEHIDKWKWQVNDNGWVNFPDYQGRIWRNRQNIRWKNQVHEVLEGHQEHTFLPREEEFCFYHPKTIDRQEKQNEFYAGI